mgnify:CR=1 FL=1|tara:strand:- start:31743 stop:32249 length:507 start_codon:yes stop_codon:yes gene_type:complete
MKNILGYEGVYKVTTDGKVFSVRRGRFLKASKSTRYHLVCLCVKGLAKGFLVHRLVAIAYIANPSNKKEINHIDGDRSNNDVSNLEWCTRSENMIHAHKNGLTNPCSLFTAGDPRRADKSKLSKDEVTQIRERFDAGEKAASIWVDFKKIAYSNIRRCCKRESFRAII